MVWARLPYRAQDPPTPPTEMVPALPPSSQPQPTPLLSAPSLCPPRPFLPPHLLSALAPVTFLSSGSRETLTKGMNVKPENEFEVCSCYLLVSAPLPPRPPLPPRIVMVQAGPAHPR